MNFYGQLGYTPPFHTRRCSFSSLVVYSWHIFQWARSISSQTNCFYLPSCHPKMMFSCHCFPSYWSCLICHRSDRRRLRNLVQRTHHLPFRQNDLLQQEQDLRGRGGVSRPKPSSSDPPLQTETPLVSCGGILEAQRHATGRKFMNLDR